MAITGLIGRGVKIAGLSLIAAGACAFRIPPSSPMAWGAPAKAPSAYLAFCAREKAECRLETGEGAGAPVVAEEAATASAPPPSALRRPPPGATTERLTGAHGVAIAPHAAPAVTLDAETWKRLEMINRRTNWRVRFRGDAEAHGRADLWSLPHAGSGGRLEGDCEDYALEKRRLLREAGVPHEAMTMAVAILPDGQWHAVLVVATDRGDYVLDNRYGWVLPWTSLDYTWVSRETGERADRWRFIASASAPQS